jgi:hypothetical protein
MSRIYHFWFESALKRTGWEKIKGRKIFTRTILLLTVWTALLLVLSYNGFFSQFETLAATTGPSLIDPFADCPYYCFFQRWNPVNAVSASRNGWFGCSRSELP